MRLRTVCPNFRGMSQITSFKDVIDIWPSHGAMAADIGASEWMIPKWSQRNNIPSEWWASVLATDRARASLVTAELLTLIAAREPAEART